MKKEPVLKVAVFVIRQDVAGTELLVFEHPLQEGGVMVQVPAGTIELGESPEAAAIRELREESGVQRQLITLAGIRDEAWEGEERRRWIYLLRAPEALSNEWPSPVTAGLLRVVTG